MHRRSRALAFLATCGRGREPPERPRALAAIRQDGAATPKRGGSITIARIEDSQSFDKTNVFQNESIWIASRSCEPLYLAANDGKTLKPWLATSYTMSKDGKTYTFKLRPGVKFSNGKPMTSADVKFSIDDARVQKKGWGYLDAAIKSITTPDPSTVVFHLKFRWAPFLADIGLFANGIIPKNFGGETRTAFYKHPIGTGPFMWDKRIVGQSVTFKRNPQLLAEGQAVPRLRHVDVRQRRQHARAAAARRPDPGRRVPAVQLDHEAAEHERRDDDAVPVDAHRLPRDERGRTRRSPTCTSAGRSRTRSTARRSSSRCCSATASRRTRSCRRRCRSTTRHSPGPAVRPGEGQGRAREVEVHERLQGPAARRRRRAGRRTRSARSSSRR